METRNYWHLAACIIVASTTVGCAASQTRTCPTTHIDCDCFELEDQQPLPEIAELREGLEALDDPSLRDPISAIAALEQRCRAEDSWLPPSPPERDADWRVRCSSAEVATPAILRTLERLEARRGQATAFREQENTLVVGLTSAMGNIILGNPESPCRSSVVNTLISLLEAPETAQDLRINFHALRLLGVLGDTGAAAPITGALFLRGERRDIDLFEDARSALQQLADPSAAARALVNAGQLEDQRVVALQQGDPGFDVRLIKQRVALVLGELGSTEPFVIEYLMSELRHEEEDALDNAPPHGRQRWTPALSKAQRRGWAARALGRLGHEPALAVILPRLELNEDGSSVDPTVDVAEVPGYLDALGDMLTPSRTDAALLLWLQRGDERLADHAARRLMLQGSPELADRLAEAAERFPRSGTAGRIRESFDEVYVPTLRDSADCSSTQCWAERLTAETSSDGMKLRAAYQLALLPRSAADRENARDALIGGLQGARGELLEAITFAIDRGAPQGCDSACLARLDAELERRYHRGAITHEERTLAALRGRLRGRATP